jgi:metal-responsive CopG/Arc/MetJ family transcriptional regulator
MAKVLLSIPDEELKKIDDYRKKKGLKRNRFFMEAVNSYFLMEEKDEYFTRKKNAVKEIRKLSKELMKNDSKDWDPVKELRKVRDGRAYELLKRWEGE